MPTETSYYVSANWSPAGGSVALGPSGGWTPLPGFTVDIGAIGIDGFPHPTYLYLYIHGAWATPLVSPSTKTTISFRLVDVVTEHYNSPTCCPIPDIISTGLGRWSQKYFLWTTQNEVYPELLFVGQGPRYRLDYNVVGAETFGLSGVYFVGPVSQQL